MSEDILIPVKESAKKNTWCDEKTYTEMYKKSVLDPEGFWAEHGKRITWIKPFQEIMDVDFSGDVHIRWFADGTLNASANCIDRHLPEKKDDIAIIWEGDDPTISKTITYGELYENVCRFANVLKARGIKKGDRVTIYMPMIPEAAYAMLACARIGAVHSVIFGGFSAESISGRILDCKSTSVITADEGVRGTKKIPLKANVDEALKKCPDVHTTIVIRHTGAEVDWDEARDV
ncbi:MAG: acetyl-coenzyme A synthetase, partial [Alphaproteobacteria bacterium]